MKHLIIVDEAEKVFHLTNGDISYLLAVEEGGLLAHLYFGKAVKDYHGQRRYPRIDRGFSGNLPDSLERGFSPDTLLREYAGAGEGDYRLPAILVEQANGSQATQFVYDRYEVLAGKPTLEGLPASYVLDDNEAETLVVYLKDAVAGLELALSYTVYADRPVITRSARLDNQSDASIKIEKMASMAVDFPAQALDLISLPGAHVNERHINREALSYGQKRLASRRGTTSHQMNNTMILAQPKTDEFTGEAYGFSLVYSGNHALEIERDQIEQTRVVIGINEEQFSWELTAGAHFQTPEVVMTYSHQGLNALSQAFHSLIRDRVARGKYQHALRPILVNNWEATYFDFDEAKLRPIVDEAKQLGIEMFVLDDGWFGHRDNDDSSLGDWFVDKNKFPNGLNGFADYVHSQGLKFGLWFEPEMISEDSELFRNHPDYRLAVPGRKPSPSRQQFVLDLGREEVREAVLVQVEALLDQGYIDYIKWDMNRHLSDIFSASLPAGRQGEVFHRYTLGLYDMLERLTSKYPDILWEGCSGGGGRFDIGFAYYMPQSWTSDNTDAVARLGIQYGTSLVYPSSVMTSHVSAVPNHQTGRITPFDTRGDVAMSGVLGYELDLTKLTEEEKELVKAQVAVYKDIRELVQYGNFTRLKSPFEGNETAWMVTNADKSEILVFTFLALNNAQQSISQVKLTGLDSDKIYENVETKEIFGGDELEHMGWFEAPADHDFLSRRYHFKAIK